MNTKNKSIELDHVGPIEHLTIPIPEGGGVVVLKGKNGSGKTHALNGVESLYNRESRKGLRNSDGMPSGKIEGLGVAVRLGRSNTLKGELVCESLDGRVDPSLLVDPGIKDPVKADAKRLESLVRLGGVKVSAEQWIKAMSDIADQIALQDMVDDDPVVTADRVRRRIHEVALQQERLSKSKADEGAALVKSVEDISGDASDAAAVSSKLDAASEALLQAESERKVGQSALANYEQSKTVLDAMDWTDDADAISEDIRAAQKTLGNDTDEFNLRNAELDEAIKKVAQLESVVEKARSKMEIAENRLAEANRTKERFERDRAKVAELREVVSKGKPSIPTEEEIAKLRESKAAATKAVQQFELVKRAIETRNKAESLLTEAGELMEVSEKYRSLARSTDSVLEQALIDAGFTEIKVHDGRLCVESDRGLEPFSDLSHGERWRLALDLAAAGLPEGSVLPVCQEAFESLDPNNREHINQLARERKLVIVTAEATNGDLRAEVMI